MLKFLIESAIFKNVIEFIEGGASSNPCSDIFAGTSPFSEIEARSFAQYISEVPNLLVHLAFHSYGHLLMLPYGYTKEHKDNYDEALGVAASAAEKLAQRYGTVYKYGNIAETICKELKYHFTTIYDICLL
jgi:hypothetical protein